MTKDAEKFLCICYRDYLSRVKDGNSKSDSRRFSKNYKNENPNFANWHADDFAETRRELKRLGILNVEISGAFSILPNGIDYMENRFKNNLKELTEFISQFIP